jgi:hypothetical protein
MAGKISHSYGALRTAIVPETSDSGLIEPFCGWHRRCLSRGYDDAAMDFHT